MTTPGMLEAGCDRTEQSCRIAGAPANISEPVGRHLFPGIRRRPLRPCTPGCRIGFQHDLSRGGRVPARPHAGERTAEIYCRVHPSKQSDRTRSPRSCPDPVQFWSPARCLAFRALSCLSRCALYRNVEATSVTPWAPRARDKALHAVFAAAVRHLVSGMDGRRGSDRDFDPSDTAVQMVLAAISRPSSFLIG